MRSKRIVHVYHFPSSQHDTLYDAREGETKRDGERGREGGREEEERERGREEGEERVGGGE